MLFADELDPPPGDDAARPFLIACDESGSPASGDYYAFGSLWLPWDRRGEFLEELRHIGEQHGVSVEHGPGSRHEFKWTKVSAAKLPFYKAVVEWFFRRSWLCFHCIVFRRSLVDMSLHKDRDEALAKHYTLLLTNKIARALRRQPRRRFRVWLDPLSVSYQKADEVLGIVTNNMLQERAVHGVFSHRSHEAPAIQLCDLLLGAVWAAWEGKTNAPAKLALQKCIADHLGWSDLRADTRAAERKFNVWTWCDPDLRPPDFRTRPVELKYPLRGPVKALRRQDLQGTIGGTYA